VAKAKAKVERITEGFAEPPLRPIALREAAVRLLEREYNALSDQMRRRHTHDIWNELQKRLRTRDPQIAQVLDGWSSLDRDDVIYRLQHPHRGTPTMLWRFERSLTCSLVEGMAGRYLLVIDTDSRRYKREEFADREAALARAEELRRLLEATGSWRAVPIEAAPADGV
jgi:hypothetical protein